MRAQEPRWKENKRPGAITFWAIWLMGSARFFFWGGIIGHLKRTWSDNRRLIMRTSIKTKQKSCHGRSGLIYIGGGHWEIIETMQLPPPCTLTFLSLFQVRSRADSQKRSKKGSVISTWSWCAVRSRFFSKLSRLMTTASCFLSSQEGYGFQYETQQRGLSTVWKQFIVLSTEGL